MKKKLAIIGASYLQLPLVLKAKEMGLETHCFSWAEGAVCKSFADFFYPISILEKENILEVCRQIKIDGIVSIASDAAVPTVSFIAENLGLVANSYKDAEGCTNKFSMRQLFNQHEIKSPKYSKATTDTRIDISTFNFPLIVKPVDRSGSRGVLKVNNEVSLDKSINDACTESFSKLAIVEEFIIGQEVSVESISWKGNHFVLAITDKVTSGEPHFVEIAHHQPSIFDERITSAIRKETTRVLDALNIKYGASHAEFIITHAGEIFAVEVGARMGGDFIGSDLVELSTGYDFIKGTIEIALGEFTPPVTSYNKCSGVYFLSKETEYLRSFIQDQSINFLVKSEITDPVLHTIKNSSDRSGYLIYQSDHRILI